MIIVIILAAAYITPGCSSDPPPPPDLTPALAYQLILQRWAQDELAHFRVVFHSDTLIECGVNNDLWKLGEIKDRNGIAWTTAYQLTERGKKVISSIDLKESGRGHEVVLKGPYLLEIGSIGDGNAPTNRKVGIRWRIDWDKAPQDLKVCLPRFELAGSEVGSFELAVRDWRFASYLSPGEVAATQSSGSVLDKLH